MLAGQSICMVDSSLQGMALPQNFGSWGAEQSTSLTLQSMTSCALATESCSGAGRDVRLRQGRSAVYATAVSHGRYKAVPGWGRAQRKGLAQG